jgi:membrane protein
MLYSGFQGVAPVTVAREAAKDFAADDMMTYAAALSFRILLALFPFLIFLLALLGTLGLTDFFDRVLGQAQLALPGEAYGLLEQVIAEIRGQTSGGVLSVSILFAIWAASTGMRSLMTALNVAYDVKEERPAWKRYPLSIVFTIGLAIMVVAAAALALVGPRTFAFLTERADVGGATMSLWKWLRWPVAVLLIVLMVAVVYYVAPNVRQPFVIVTPGSVLTVVGWIVASIGFSFYVSRFGNYTATYGSLGAVIVLLLYFFITAAVLLLGAELNAAIYHAVIGRPVVKDHSE